MASWTFVGRESELGRLTAASTGATQRGLILGGVAGIGKSRLLREGTAVLNHENHLLLTATANAATIALPLGGLTPALPADQPAATTPAGLIRWAVDAIHRQAAGRPIILAVDDAHLLDPLSAALVYYVARSGNATVLGTVRTGSPVPDPVRALWIDDLVDRVELNPLTRFEASRLLQEALGGPIDSGSADRLWRLAAGNVLLLRELILAARSGGDLSQAYGVWRWTGRLELAPTLTDVVDSHIGRLTPEVREVLELVAFGEPLGLPLLVKATDSAAIELAEERALIRVTRDDRRTTVRLGHPLYGEVVRQRCPLTRVQRMLADLAHLIEATGARRRDDLLRVAVWRLDSDTARDPGQLLRACRQAFSRYQIPLAIRLGRAAVAAGGGVDAAEVLATILMFGDQPVDALHVLDSVTDRIDDDHQRARWLGIRSITRYWGLTDETTIDSLASSADEFTAKAELSWVNAVEAIMSLHHGEVVRAQRLATAVLDEPASGPAPRALARSAMGHLLAASGAAERTIAAMADVEADAAAWRSETPYIQLAVELARGTAMIVAGDLKAVDEMVAAEFADMADAGGFGLGSGYLTVVRAQAARLRGDLVEAGQLAAQACVVLSPGQVFAGIAHAERAHAAALRGDATLAAEAMAEADRSHRGTMAILYPWLEQARAWVAVAAGDRDGGVRVLRRLSARLRVDGFYGHEVLVQLDLARLGEIAEPVRRMRLLTTFVQGPIVSAVSWFISASALRDGTALAASVTEFEDLRLYLYAAEAAATAVTLLRDQRSTDVPEAAGRLATLMAKCPAAHTPALDIKQPVLTPRERQIARMAAAGVSSKEIADQLYLSSRTVDNHLMRVYAKLGVNGRTALTASLRSLPD